MQVKGCAESEPGKIVKLIGSESRGRREKRREKLQGKCYEGRNTGSGRGMNDSVGVNE